METTTINTFGNLTKQPVTRTSSKNNQPYTIFTVAYNPTEGERAFVKCFVWSTTQQKFASKLEKGDRVHIIGDASQRETKNGVVTFVKVGYFRKHDRSRQAA